MKSLSKLFSVLILVSSYSACPLPWDNAPKQLLFTGAFLSGLCGGSLMWKTMAHDTSPAKSSQKQQVSSADEQFGFNYSRKQLQKFFTEPRTCFGISIGLLCVSGLLLRKAAQS